MIERLKLSLKDDLAALKAGQSIDTGGGGDATGTSKTQKRKAKAADIEEDGGPKKKGRKPAASKMEIKEELELEHEF